MTLGVTSQLHYLSIKRAIQVLRQNNFDPNTMICRPANDGTGTSKKCEKKILKKF